MSAYKIQAKKTYIVMGEEFDTLEEAQAYAECGHHADIIQAYLDSVEPNMELSDRARQANATRDRRAIRAFLEWAEDCGYRITGENL